MKRNNAVGSDGLSPTLFKDGGYKLPIALTGLVALIWESEEVPSGCCYALVSPINKEGKRTPCENPKGISLVDVASELLTGIILRS